VKDVVEEKVALLQRMNSPIKNMMRCERPRLVTYRNDVDYSVHYAIWIENENVVNQPIFCGMCGNYRQTSCLLNESLPSSIKCTGMCRVGWVVVM